MKRDWSNPAYLQKGTPRQQGAYHCLMALDIFNRLHDYTPILAGTIPLGIDTPTSDLDIICEAHDLAAFLTITREMFGGCEGFESDEKVMNGLPSVIVTFMHDGFSIQLFAQGRAVKKQNAYRHMIVEARLLKIGGDGTASAIQQLKLDGMKTEPAFAYHFNLKGDPYQVLLELSYLDEYELAALIARRQLGGV